MAQTTASNMIIKRSGVQDLVADCNQMNVPFFTLHSGLLWKNTVVRHSRVCKREPGPSVDMNGLFYGNANEAKCTNAAF